MATLLLSVIYLIYLHNNYKNDEIFAKDNKLGMWGGKFERPEIWRRNNKKK